MRFHLRLLAAAGLPALLLALAGLTTAVTTTLARSASADEATLEPRIVNGLMTSDLPTTGALLFGSSPASATSWCSGTMIGCNTFLTAAHCVCDLTGAQCQGANAPDPSDYYVFLQHSGTHAVQSVTVHPSFNFPVGDVAIVKLTSPVDGISPSPINTSQAPASGTPGTIAGFGRSGGGNFDYGLKRYGDVTTSACPAGVSGTTSVCWRYENPIGPPGTDSNTCNADSGGPLFIDFGLGDVVAGITSGGENANCLALDRSYDANVWFYRDWIATTAGVDIGNTTCGTRSQVGDADTFVDGFTGTLSTSQPEGRASIAVEPGTSALVVTLNGADDGTQSFDLYVKRGSPPTVSSFDCRSNGNVQYEACQFEDPAADTFHLLANRVSGSGAYQLTATQFAALAPSTAEIDLVSSVSSVAQGGTFPSTVNLSNATGAQQSFILTLRLVIPGGAVVPLIAGIPLTFPNGAAASPAVNLPIAMGFPTGNFTLVGLLLHPTTFAVLDHDTALFTVTTP